MLIYNLRILVMFLVPGLLFASEHKPDDVRPVLAGGVSVQTHLQCLSDIEPVLRLSLKSDAEFPLQLNAKELFLLYPSSDAAFFIMKRQTFSEVVMQSARFSKEDDYLRAKPDAPFFIDRSFDDLLVIDRGESFEGTISVEDRYDLEEGETYVTGFMHRTTIVIDERRMYSVVFKSKILEITNGSCSEFIY